MRKTRHWKDQLLCIWNESLLFHISTLKGFDFLLSRKFIQRYVIGIFYRGGLRESLLNKPVTPSIHSPDLVIPKDGLIKYWVPQLLEQPQALCMQHRSICERGSNCPWSFSKIIDTDIEWTNEKKVWLWQATRYYAFQWQFTWNRLLTSVKQNSLSIAGLPLGLQWK